MAKYHDCGCIVLKTEANNHLEPTCAIMDEIGAPYEQLTPEEVKRRLPIATMESFGPAKRTDDPGFGEPNGRTVAGGVFFPSGGYISDPQLATHNLQRAAEANGAVFRFNSEVVEIRQVDGRVAGVTLAGGEAIDAPVVVNVAEPIPSRSTVWPGSRRA